MDPRRNDSDVVVVGGGPGGCAAAITCASMGLRVRLLERQVQPTERPGETLHPGVERVLAQLGVADRFADIVGSRHEGIRIEWAGTKRFEGYGRDDAGPWQGFQIWRPDFDALLLQRAQELGVEVLRPCTAQGMLQERGKIRGVLTNSGPMTAAVVVDASGRSHWSGSALGIGRRRFSPRLVARYGYAQGSCPALDADPCLVGDSAGWLWTALIRPGLYQWTRVTLDGHHPLRNWCPDAFRELTPHGPPRGADVTWRMALTVARPGWFMVGDAAAVLDPTSANGVLRALLSGIIAGKLACAVVPGLVRADEAAKIYSDWISEWFKTSAAQLAKFYQLLGVPEFGIDS